MRGRFPTSYLSDGKIFETDWFVVLILLVTTPKERGAEFLGCQDIDDALHARELGNGNWEVGVHIADVTHFVKSATPMDEEAKGRGTTVYLVDKRIDMLPMMLGTDLCSLVGGRDRYAMSVLWVPSPSPRPQRQRLMCVYRR